MIKNGRNQSTTVLKKKTMRKESDSLLLSLVVPSLKALGTKNELCQPPVPWGLFSEL